MARNARNKQPRPRVPVPLTDIQEEFRAQLNLLSKSCNEYDAGDRDEFRRIALAIRILLYDHRQSKSICGQLGLKDLAFKTYSRPAIDGNFVASTPLVIIRVGPGEAMYLPQLDQGPFAPRLLPFEEWWREEVFRSPSGVSMDRSGFVLHTANQAGGAHVDSELDEDFHRIAKANEAGWIAAYGEVAKPMADLEKAYVRHIGFEVLQTLHPAWVKLQGNRLCECGSGRKHRYCHGKA